MATGDFHALTSVLDYPMFVVTCADGDDRAGCLVGFATQCSIHPPRYLVCISAANHTATVAHGAAVLAVHLLASDQKNVAELFGSRKSEEVDKFDRAAWTSGPEGVPLLVDCPNRFVGRIVERLPLGDHTGYLLDMITADASEGARAGGFEPLTFQQVRDLEPGHPA